MDATGIKHDISFEELHEIVAPIAEKYGTAHIYLFGSRAQGADLKTATTISTYPWDVSKVSCIDDE
jgi:hypothetical protein